MSWIIQDEKNGNMPYLVIWISLNRLISTSHHTTIDSANRQYNHLKEIGREPTILAVLEPSLE